MVGGSQLINKQLTTKDTDINADIQQDAVTNLQFQNKWFHFRISGFKGFN